MIFFNPKVNIDLKEKKINLSTRHVMLKCQRCENVLISDALKSIELVRFGIFFVGGECIFENKMTFF